MFKPEDYELPLQKAFQLSVINSDIDKCDDIDLLKKQLKESVRLAMNYQQLLTVSVKELITKDMTNWFQETDNI